MTDRAPTPRHQAAREAVQTWNTLRAACTLDLSGYPIDGCIRHSGRGESHHAGGRLIPDLSLYRLVVPRDWEADMPATVSGIAVVFDPDATEAAVIRRPGG